jgi:hypothetical protein
MVVGTGGKLEFLDGTRRLRDKPNWSPEMSSKWWQVGGLILSLSAIATLTSCGGATSAPISGFQALGGVSVSITPASMDIKTDTMETFTAVVNNSNVQGVQWQVNGIPGGGGDIGTIDKNGNYSAPHFVPNPSTVTITAVADADNTKSGNANAIITGNLIPATVIMSPTQASLQVGTQVKLSGGVLGPADTSVVWQVNGIANGNSTVGTIVPGKDNTAVYTAPAKVPNPATVTIQAVSHAEPNKMATCPMTISLNTPTVATVTLTPVVAVTQAQNNFSMTAEVINDPDNSVYWEVDGDVGGSQLNGTIASEGPGLGVYTAPMTVPLNYNTVTIRAISNGQPSRSSSAIMGISGPPPLGVSVNVVGGTAVEVGSSLGITATVANAQVQTVTWKVNGITNGNGTVGTIVPVNGQNNQVTYFAPSQVPTQEAVVVSAIPDADPRIAGTLPITIQLAPVTVTVSPGKSQLGITQQGQFTATMTNLSNQDANWYVGQGNTFVQGGNATLGFVTPSSNANVVTYTAPDAVPTNPTVVIKAISEAVPSAYGTATVTILSHPVVTVQITPSEPQQVQVGDSVGPYSAVVTGDTNQNVDWYICLNPNSCSQDGQGGTYGSLVVNPNDPTQELYVAPFVVPNPSTVYVEARSQDFPDSISNLDAITIENVQQQPQVQIDPPPYPILPGGNEQVSAVVTDIDDHTVDWVLTLPNGDPCSQATCGTVNPSETDNAPTTYTAPQSIPQDPYTVYITAISHVDPNAKDTQPITISNDAAAFIAISPAQPDPIQAGSSNVLNFTVTITNDPPDSRVLWSLGCISEADEGLWCGKPFDHKGDGIGCLIAGDGTKNCSQGASVIQDGTLNVQYSPPPEMGNQFLANACASEPDGHGDGFIPLSVELNAGNCAHGGVCQSVVCIEVTPAGGARVFPLPKNRAKWNPNFHKP